MRPTLKILIPICLIAAFAVIPLPGRAAWQPKTELDKIAPFRRILWVTRWDYAKESDVAKIMYNAASARFTDVLFQVRGSGTVFYKSKLEPWALELTQNSDDAGAMSRGVGRDPGWDPLAKAVAEGHRYGLRVHAYMNVMPGWTKLPTPAAATGQLYAVHPEWFMVDKNGRRMSNREWYAFVEPSMSEVREHLAAVFAEVARNYAVDGIHLDYIRYPNERGDFSYHPRAKENFRAKYGASPAQKPAEWRQFRRDQITAVVAAISKAVRKERPGIEISAAVHRDRDTRDNETFQDVHRWVEDGLVDCIAPMNYTQKMDEYERVLSNFRGPFWKGHVWAGLWCDPERNTIPEREVRRAVALDFDSVAVYSYEYLFPKHRQNKIALKIYQSFVKSAPGP